MGNLGEILGQGWKAEDHKGGILLPAAEYECMITKAELKDTKDGTGRYIKVELKTRDNRLVWDNITVVNKNEMAVTIGQGQLANLCEACGMASVSDTEQFVGHTVIARVGIEKGKDGRDDQNKVKSYKTFRVGSGVADTSGRTPF
jgi:ribosomal protein S8